MLFPTRVSWKMCNGSLPHLRGYPCGLWVLMHTLTVLTLPINHTQPHPLTSTHALIIMTKFIKNFFSCEVCREHFVEMSWTIAHRPMGDPGDAILWAWETHNAVSARLSSENGPKDTLHPKSLFPSINQCPYCYLSSPARASHVTPNFTNTKFASGEHFLVGMAEKREPHPASRSMLLAVHQQDASMFVWNRTAVLLYLWHYYHLGHFLGKGKVRTERRHHGVSQSAVLQAAWPQNRHRVNDMKWRHTAESADPEVCLLPYLLCAAVFVLLLWVLWRRRCRILAWTRVLSSR
jgi:hypothetical protein